MKRYRLIKDEVYPVLGIEEDAEGGQPIPPNLVRRFNAAQKRLSEAENAILEWTDVKEWFER